MSSSKPESPKPSVQSGEADIGRIAETGSRRHIITLILIFGTVLLAASTMRHQMFRSGGLDLGFFDQLIYLISRGQRPFSSILGWHLLGDHAAYTVYLLAPLYWIWPNVHMLLAAQAFALASGAYPLWRLATLSGLSDRHALAIGLAYLLYPLVLAANIADFHPETISVPAILFAVLFAKENRLVPFVLAILVALGGKEVCAFPVAAMGFWLLAIEGRKRCGALAMLLSVIWFCIAMLWVVPHFGAGKQSSGVQYYSYLGGSLSEVVKNLFLRPHLWLAQIFSVRALKYLIILLAPVAWGISPKRLAPMIGALPIIGLILLSDPNLVDMAKPFSQYSVLVIPFLALTVLSAAVAGKAWLTRPGYIATWSIALVLLGATARLMRVNTDEATDFSNHAAAREALARVDGKGGVLTTHELTPHVSQRELVQFIDPERSIRPIENFEFVLLNLDHQSARSAEDLTQAILARLEVDPQFRLEYRKDDVFLYRRLQVPPPVESAPLATIWTLISQAW